MNRRSLGDLKGEFKHISKKTEETGIITGLMNIKKLKKNRMKLKSLYKKLNKTNKHTCSKCSFNIKIGGGSKPIYIKHRDMCYMGSRIKLHKPNIVTISGKRVEYNFKPVIRKCNKHDLNIKHS